MKLFKNIFLHITLKVLFCVCLTLAACAAQAKNNEFEIKYLNISQLDDELRVDAEIDYELNNEVREALVNGITLQFQVEVQVKSVRKWGWDKTVSEVKQTHMLKYHALSKQFIWEGLSTDSSVTFPDLDSALIYRGQINAMYIAEKGALEEEGNHLVRIRSRLLTNKLPLPLRMKSYISPKWRLTSGWYKWPL